MGKPTPHRTPSHPDPNGIVRIIGGDLRGSILAFDVDPRVRPMKDRVREAVFNLLGDDLDQFQAIDLFAGTGALGVEALSRGALGATFFERHFPTARTLEDALERLGLEEYAQVHAGDAFFWARQLLGPNAAQDDLPDRSHPWLVFFSPPYQLYYERRKELKQLVGEFLREAPPGSRIVVESDDRFDPAELPQAEQWQVRTYPPAIIAIFRLAPASDAEPAPSSPS